MGEVIRFPGGAGVAVGLRRLLWREAVGHELRSERQAQHRTQGEVAGAAGISTQYLSEVERGRKEPSSEILEAAAGALGLDVAGLARRAADLLASTLDLTDSVAPDTSAVDGGASGRPDGPVLLAA